MHTKKILPILRIGTVSQTLWGILVLLALTFTTFHDYLYTADHNHYDVVEYIQEQNTPPIQAQSDLCRVHFAFHQSFPLPSTPILSFPPLEEKPFFDVPYLYHDFYPFHEFKPPIYRS